MFSNNYHYILLNYTLNCTLALYIGITIITRSLAWSISVLFVSLTQSVNGAQFFKYYILFLLSGATAVPVFGSVIVPLTSM